MGSASFQLRTQVISVIFDYRVLKLINYGVMLVEQRVKSCPPSPRIDAGDFLAPTGLKEVGQHAACLDIDLVKTRRKRFILISCH